MNNVKTAPGAKKSTKVGIFGTTFQYLGFTFEPVRRFTRKEERMGINLPLCSIGVSNYFDMNNWRSDKWDHNLFYRAAEKLPGTGVMDIFLMDGKALVIPGTNELWAYGKEEAEKLPKKATDQTATQKYQELSVLIRTRLESIQVKIRNHGVAACQSGTKLNWAHVVDFGRIHQDLKDLDDSLVGW